MTISIVSQFVPSALPATIAATPIDQPASVGLAGPTADFASLLAALTSDPRSSPRIPEDALRQDEKTTQTATETSTETAAATAATAGPADALAAQAAMPLFVATPGLTPATPTPRSGFAGTVGEAAATASLPGGDSAPARTLRLLAPMAAETAGKDALSADPATTAGERQTPLPAIPVGDQQAAKLAAPNPLAATSEGSRPAPPDANSPPLAAPSIMPSGAAPSAPLAAAHAAHQLTAPLGHPGWADDFAQKVLWFADNDRQQAQLTLNPAQLGQVEITLSIEREVTSAHFASANADVRSAIESSLPRLRELLAGAGVQLGQVTVGSESDRQPPAREDPTQSPRRRSDDAILGVASGTGQPAHALAIRRGSALVDLFV